MCAFTEMQFAEKCLETCRLIRNRFLTGEPEPEPASRTNFFHRFVVELLLPLLLLSLQ